MQILVAIHTPRLPYSAVYLGYAQFARYLTRTPHALTILTPDDFPRLGRIHGRWLPLVYPFLVDRWLRREERRLDLVVFHSYAGWWANLRSRRPFKTVTAFHGLEPTHYAELERETRQQGHRLRLPFRILHGWLLPRLIRLSCRRSDLVLCLNRAEAEYLQIHRWADRASLAVFAHGAAPEFFVPRTFAAEARTVCFVGQWLERKGIGYLVEAFSNVARSRSDLRLCCVGTLVDADRVLASFPAEIRSRVDVYPRVDQVELARLYEGADLFVFPTLFEGFSRALIEAMAAALPIVTTPVGAAPDLLESEVNCLMVPVRDARALERAMARLVDDAGLRERLGLAAQRKAREFDLDRVHESLLSILTSVLQRATT